MHELQKSGLHKKTQLLRKYKTFEHLQISYRDTTVHPGPVLCVLHKPRTARNDNGLLLLSRGPPRAVVALTSGSVGFVLLSSTRHLQLGFSEYLGHHLSLHSPKQLLTLAFTSVPSCRNTVAVTVTGVSQTSSCH